MSESPKRQFDAHAPESCAGCGLCCEGIGSPVVLFQSRPAWEAHHPFRPEGIPAHLIEEIDAHFAGVFRGEEPQEQCFWYDPDTRQCKHYEWRPQVCRDYELGGRECLALRRPLVHAPKNAATESNAQTPQAE